MSIISRVTEKTEWMDEERNRRLSLGSWNETIEVLMLYPCPIQGNYVKFL